MKKKMMPATIIFIATLILLIFTGCSSESTESQESENAINSSDRVDWSMDIDCTSCHVGEAESATSAAYLCGRHFEENNTCISCHNEASSLTEAHEEVTTDSKLPKRLKDTEVTEETCLTCHDQADLVAVTANSTTLSDKEGTTVNPHELPVSESHAIATCINCHSVHTTETSAEAAVDTCTGCHHENVYECHTCHN